MIPQPLIVPLVMANFDKLASKATYKCEIKKPFRMSDFTILDENDKYFPRIVKRINEQYAVWVRDLILEDNNFKSKSTCCDLRDILHNIYALVSQTFDEI